MTSHPAVVVRGMGKFGAAGCLTLLFLHDGNHGYLFFLHDGYDGHHTKDCWIGDFSIKQGD